MVRFTPMLSFGLGAVAVALTSGCGQVASQQVTRADEVTLPNAMKAIACGLKTYQNELSRLRFNTGGILDEAEVTLNLKASAAGNNELVVDAKPSFHGVSPFGITSKSRSESLGSRDNTIHLIFKYLYTASLNEPGKAQVKKQPLLIAPGPTTLVPVDEPCNDQTIVISVKQMQEIQRKGHE